MTYLELNQEVNQLAQFFKIKNVKRGERVAFLATNRLEHLTILLACSKIGAFFVPLNFRLSNNEIEKVMERISPTLYLGIGEKVLNVETPYVDLSKIDLKTFGDIHDANFYEENSKMHETILMLFTSGSTGEPKGVMFHGQMLLSNQIETCKNWGLFESDITLVETPFFHTGGYNVLLLPLLYIGGTSIIAESFNVDNVLKMIEQEKVSVYFGVPTMFQIILENDHFKKINLNSIRFFISGGAACSVPMIQEYQKRGVLFKQGFGLTEVGPNCFLLDEKYSVTKAGSIGKPMPHSKVIVVDKNGLKVGANTPGELWIKGPHVCAGYFNNESAFSETTFDGYFKTGDIVQFDNDGFYFVVGRIKDMYISGGENVYPGEVEKMILNHHDISEAIVVAVKSEKWGEVGFAFLKSANLISLNGLREHLNPLLSRYKHPHFVKCVNEFPLLPNGKVDRKLLKKMAEELARKL